MSPFDSHKEIPLQEIIARCDELFNAGKGAETGEFLRQWRQQAQVSGDERGELSLLNELIGHYRMNCDPRRGKEAVNSALDLIKKLALSETLSAGTIMLNAATALQSFGETEEALTLYKESRRIYEKTLPPGDKRFAGLLNNMAAAYVEKGEFKAAENCYLDALALLQESKDLMDSAVTCLNLAQLYRSWNNDTELIAAMLGCAMEYFDSPQSVRDGYYAHTCSKCASGFGALGRKDIEEELKSRAEKIYAGY